MSSLPLAGRCVLVTRAAHQAGKLSAGLRAEGADVVEVPVLEIRPPESFDSLDQAIRNLNSYDWLILTSVNAVFALVERSMELGIELAPSSRLKLAAIGQSTASAARKAGFAVTFVPESYVAESLVPHVAGEAAGQRILLARAAVARDLIPNALRAAGADVDVADAYRNAMPENAPERLRGAIGQGIDAVMLTSSSSVTHLAVAAKAARIEWPFADVAAISIGPITSGTLRDQGWEPVAEAKVSDIPGLVEAAVSFFGGRSRGQHV